MPAKRGKSVKKGRQKTQVTKKTEPEVVTLKFHGGHQYTGIVCTSSLGKRSLETPQATYTWRDGPTYEGPFLDSQLEGSGKYTWPDGSSYVGAVSNGKRNGYGVYIAADGITKYEGQWFEGKRHGTGQLTYDSAGEAFYTGQWEDGCKHGEGRQVWASKNVYEGQWKQGAMSGYGTMLWQDNGSTESYSGHWENGFPQGTGKHVWQTPDSTRPELGSKEMPSQQTNNSYEGQWVLGVRQGVGTFQYASGAAYQGDWHDGIKQGEGRYTYEDGNVYSGSFVADNMATPGASRYSATSGNAALNIGGSDNPVRRCMDVSDLEAFCLPNDRGERDAKSEGISAYDEPDEVLRELYNMLLRNMAELKTVYGQLRKSLQTDDNDPWVVSLHQFWTLARDAGLVLPDCPLSRLNRHMRSGPRHHMEACNMDAEEVRPLTPRQIAQSEAGSRLGMAREGRLASKETAGGAVVVDPSGEAKEGAAQQEDEEEEYEEDAEDMESEQGSREGEENRQDSKSRQISDAASVASHAAEDEASLRPSPASSPSPYRTPTAMKLESPFDPMYSKFWRKEGGLEHEENGRLYDVHSAGDKFMFRHFLESIIRWSQACFPDLKGLERMVKTLMRDHLLPLAGPPAWVPKAQNFQFLAEKKVQQVFASFKPKLWQVFVENASGDGAYQRPLWAKPSEDGESDKLALGRQLRRQFGGVQRRVHVRARMDVTVRVKDVLHVLDKAGLLQCSMRRSDVLDWRGTVFPERIPVPRPASRDTQNTTPLPDLGNLGDLLNLGNDAQGSSPSPGVPSRPSTSLDRKNSNQSHQVGTERQETLLLAEGVDDEDLSADALILEDFLKSDFRVTFLRVLATLTEVMQPQHSTRISWILGPGASQELVSLLDFLETELTFTEFQRLLLCMARCPRLEESEERKIPRHVCLENFLEKIFVPALAKPFSYEPPPSEAPQGELEQAADEQSLGKIEDVKSAGVEATETGEHAGGEAEAEQIVPEPEPELDFWHGFCDPYDLEASVPGAPRVWPEGWAEEVASY
eukprot:TRINITY_DN4815_c0_g2_i1.p1 TRINITY_DN4815_c0_g2~~TRINITY_DN4815_c0_g2_i1.p1  ORF type:complete len:1032 (+),score=202.24 TRINITY_DN4815_c0_g2_i1:41-3136(+)